MDPRDQRIGELEALVAAKDAQLAERDAQLAAQGIRITELERKVEELTQLVMTLQEQLGKNSGNSNQPPSSDSPGERAERHAKTKSGRKRGGQPGHSGSSRELVPPEQVSEFIHLFPPECENCWKALPTLTPMELPFA